MPYEDFEFRFSAEKDIWLRANRNMSFERIINEIGSGNLVLRSGTRNTSKYPNQNIFVVLIDEYCWTVPCVIDGNKIFFKTAFRDRKMDKKMSAIIRSQT